MRSLIFRLVLSIGLIVLLLAGMRAHWSDILVLMKGVTLRTVLLAFCLYSAVFLFMSLRLRCLFRCQLIPMSVPDSLRLTAIGLFFNNFLPTGAGGDVVKAYVAGRQTNQNFRSILCILMDRVIGLATLVFMGSLSIFFLNRHSWNVPPLVVKINYLLLSIAALAITILMVPSLYQIVTQWLGNVPIKHFKIYLGKLISGIEEFRNQKANLIKAMTLSVMAQIAFTSLVYLFSHEMGTNISFKIFLLTLPLVHMSAMIPSLNGLGVREGAFVYLFGNVLGREKAFVVALSSTTIMVVWSLIGGLIYWLWVLKRGGLQHDR